MPVRSQNCCAPRYDPIPDSPQRPPTQGSDQYEFKLHSTADGRRTKGLLPTQRLLVPFWAPRWFPGANKYPSEE